MSFFIVPTIHTQRKPPHREDNPTRTLYLSLTSITPHSHYSQPLTFSLLTQFIALWLFLTVSHFLQQVGQAFSLTMPQGRPTRRSATGYSPLHSLNLNSLIVTALTYLLVSLVSFQFSRYGGQL